MPTPARHRQLLSDAKWDNAFGRQATVEDVLRYVIGHWTVLQSRLPKEMAFKNKEPKITDRFGFLLYKHAVAAGIPGFFGVQAPFAKFGEDEEIERTGRTDLVYASDRVDPRLELVFEFKKLRKGSKDGRRDYCTEGMRRYVDGTYSAEQDVAFMVALIERGPEHDAIMHALKRSIQTPDLAPILRFIVDGQGRKVMAPGVRFPQCEFETMHARDHVPCPDLLLGHFSLVYT